MKNLMNYLLMGFAALTIISCGKSDYKKTKSGLVYKIYPGKGAKLKPNQMLKVFREYKYGDSVLQTSFDKMPEYGKNDTNSAYSNSHDLLEFLRNLSVGDSVVYSRNVDTLIARNEIPAEGNLFKKGSRIDCKLVVLGAFKDEKEMEADQKIEADKYTAIMNKKTEKVRSVEVAQLGELLKSKGINAKKTELGVYYIIDQPGTGELPKTGNAVSVLYKGYFPDGKQFDANMESGKPYDVVLGSNTVIAGWEDGLKVFNKGAKGRLFIPGSLAYGEAGRDGIQPNAVLFFDIVVADIKDLSNATVPANK